VIIGAAFVVILGIFVTVPGLPYSLIKVFLKTVF